MKKKSPGSWRQCVSYAVVVGGCGLLLCLPAMATAAGGGLRGVRPLTPRFNSAAKRPGITKPFNGAAGRSSGGKSKDKPTPAPKPRGWDPPPRPR